MMMLQLEGGNKYNINNDEWVLENLMHNEAAAPPPILLPHDLNYKYNYNYTPMAPMQTTTTTSLNPSYFLHQKKKKKENHNASERERRKKLNNLYSSLRSLLPPTPTPTPTHHHQKKKKKKKQSIPTTVSQVLKYIPQLKHQLHRLIQRKQHLIISTTPHHDAITRTRLLSDQAAAGNNNKTSCFFNTATDTAAVCVTVTPILMMNNTNTTRDDEEVVVQISQLIKHNIMAVPLSELIRVLENEGNFILINVSSSLLVPASTHLFYTLHLQAGGRNTLQPVEHIQAFLRHKILSLRRLQ